jgi:DNA-binding PadR family transcriptional regulator
MYPTDIHRAKSRVALLGLLSIRAMSGYDIKRFIAEALSNFWNESYGSIYPGLRHLAKEGLIARRTERGNGSPDRKVYSLTGRGRDVLPEWLRADTEDEPPIRSELLLKTFFGAQLGSAPLSAHIERFAQRQRQRIEQLRSVEAIVEEARKTDPNALYWHLTVRRGLLMAEARLHWAEEAARMLSGKIVPRRARRPKAAGRKS